MCLRGRMAPAFVISLPLSLTLEVVLIKPGVAQRLSSCASVSLSRLHPCLLFPLISLLKTTSFLFVHALIHLTCVSFFSSSFFIISPTRWRTGLSERKLAASGAPPLLRGRFLLPECLWKHCLAHLCFIQQGICGVKVEITAVSVHFVKKEKCSLTEWNKI